MPPPPGVGGGVSVDMTSVSVQTEDVAALSEAAPVAKETYEKDAGTEPLLVRVYGVWWLVYGIWCMVVGLSLLVYGGWCMVMV